ncbi:MAG: RNA recognition motif domain-containing protein [Gammaproteobacteria bacterium]
MNIYVGNLSYQTNDQDLRSAFEAFGKVSRATVIMDRETGRSKGFGFVEMPNNAEAEEAIRSMNGRSVDGRNIRVNQAEERKPREGGGGGGGGPGGPRRRF